MLICAACCGKSTMGRYGTAQNAAKRSTHHRAAGNISRASMNRLGLISTSCEHAPTVRAPAHGHVTFALIE
jgi:hypothetical protein